MAIEFAEECIFYSFLSLVCCFPVALNAGSEFLCRSLKLIGWLFYVAQNASLFRFICIKLPAPSCFKF